jgi:hypothetical protein
MKFPKTPEKPLFCYRVSSGYCALIDKGKYIKIYFWDGVSTTWNTQNIYEKT